MSVGSNQYVKSPGIVLHADLISAVGLSRRIRCGDVWGTQCRAWVKAPKYGHGNHPASKHVIATIKNPNCPVDILISQIGQTNHDIDALILEHTKIPSALLDQYVLVNIHATSPPVQYIPGSCNANLNPSVLETLYTAVKDSVPSQKTVWRFLSNPSCPDSMLLDYIQRPISDIALSYLLSNGTLSPQFMRSLWDRYDVELFYTRSFGANLSLVRHPNLPVEALEAAARAGLGKYVVAHPNCPPDILHAIAQYTSDLRQTIAEHPQCRVDTLELIHLWTHRNRYSGNRIVRTILQHPNCSQIIIINNLDNPTHSIAELALTKAAQYPAIIAMLALQT